MKVIERSPIGGEGGPTGINDRIKGIWQFGFSWDQDIQAQQVLISRLGKILDNSYTIISNVAITESALRSRLSWLDRLECGPFMSPR